MAKTRSPQTFGDALDRALRYQQYKAVATFVVWGLLYFAAKGRTRQAVRS